MKKSGRYTTSHLVEDQHEPGSRGQVLKNLLGITRKSEMDRVEAEGLKQAMERLVRTYDQEHRFTATDICHMHLVWLGKVYGWAGHYRQVNLSKDEFPFAAAAQIVSLMEQLERGPLRDYTPCRFANQAEVARALAVMHVELVLIHPFREGNGRLARVLATLMALQAGWPPLDFTPMLGKKREAYFAAVHAGLDRNYQPMERIFSAVIRQTAADRGKRGGEVSREPSAGNA